MDDFYRFHYRNYYQSVEVPDQEYIRKIHKDVRARYTVDFLEQPGVLDKARRILDFGCGEGSLLREISARKPELETEAIEPGETFGEFAREYAACTVYPSLEALQAASSGNFDLIMVNHVLEHIMWPNEVLATLGRLLSKNGHLYIDVPAIEGYRSVESLHIGHMYHFSESTLQALVASTGFRVVSIERHHPPRHPVSTRCLVTPGEGRSTADNRGNDSREACWSRIRGIHRTGWKFYVTSSFLYKAALFFPRRLARIMKRGSG
jgi:SAM-dependent methyltransferase